VGCKLQAAGAGWCCAGAVGPGRVWSAFWVVGCAGVCSGGVSPGLEVLQEVEEWDASFKLPEQVGASKALLGLSQACGVTRSVGWHVPCAAACA
jgi:hypothetical protein